MLLTKTEPLCLSHFPILLHWLPYLCLLLMLALKNWSTRNWRKQRILVSFLDWLLEYGCSFFCWRSLINIIGFQAFYSFTINLLSVSTPILLMNLYTLLLLVSITQYYWCTYLYCELSALLVYSFFSGIIMWFKYEASMISWRQKEGWDIITEKLLFPHYEFKIKLDVYAAYLPCEKSCF